MADEPPSLDARAAEAERSVTHLFGGRLLGMPATHLARVRYPRRRGLGAPWHYWWQAHYLDALVDAGLRRLRAGDAAGARDRAHRGDRLLATIRLRNLGRLPNAYYDDMAWLALASGRLAELHRGLGRARPGRRRRASHRVLTAQLRSAVTDDLGGGAYWNRKRDFKNVPATGPVALHLARLGDVATARALVDWMYARLQDPATGLFRDGIRVEGGAERVVDDVYSYNQGTVLGVLVTLGDPGSLDRGGELVRAVDRHLAHTVDGRRVLRTHGDGDGGLFTGILARYLALAAPALGATGDVAARLVRDTADAFWAGRHEGLEGTTFADDPAGAVSGSAAPGAPVELSTQLQAWTTLEAAAVTCREPAVGSDVPAEGPQAAARTTPDHEGTHP